MKRLLVAFATLSFFACSANAPAPEQSASPQEMPITSKSPEAIEHVRKGRDLAENLRSAEATKEYEQALALDPDFALALLYRGSATPGMAGLKDIEQAATKTAAVSKPEQLLIEATLAQRRGEFTKSQDLWRQLTEAVPDDWRAHMGRGSQLHFSQKYAEAIESLTRATELNPNAGPAYNMIGYAYLFQGKPEMAIGPLKRYAEVDPTEPNPYDSLGEALIAAGQLTEAQAAFEKAASLSSAFPVAWEGVAYTKFFAGDWTGGRAALEKARQAASRAPERVLIARISAMATLGEGKRAEGLKELDAIAASADATPADIAITPAYRAMALADGGRHREALAEADKAIEAADSGKFSPGATTSLKHWGLILRVASQAALGDVAATEQAVAAFEKEAAAKPDNPLLQSSLHLAQGLLAATRKDMKTAQSHFDRCAVSDSYCQWQAAVAGQRSKDPAAAEASRARLLKMYVRDPVYLYARSSVTRSLPKQSN